MLRKKDYRDMTRYQETARKQRRRYYQKTQIYPKTDWTLEQEELVLKHDRTDHELSQQIGHSVKAIQVKRSRLKAEQKQKEGNKS